MTIKEFDVVESEDIKACVVTNGDYSVAISSKAQAYMVCNMINRLVGNVNNETDLLKEELEECIAATNELNGKYQS